MVYKIIEFGFTYLKQLGHLVLFDIDACIFVHLDWWQIISLFRKNYFLMWWDVGVTAQYMNSLDFIAANPTHH